MQRDLFSNYMSDPVNTMLFPLDQLKRVITDKVRSLINYANMISQSMNEKICILEAESEVNMEK